MADYTELEAREARRIVKHLLARQEEEGAPDIEEALVVSDIEYDAAEFVEELQMLEEFGVNAPAIRVGEELIPLALSFIAGSSWPFSPVVWGTRGRSWRHQPFFMSGRAPTCDPSSKTSTNFEPSRPCRWRRLTRYSRVVPRIS